jgi:hypothetical protein
VWPAFANVEAIENPSDTPTSDQNLVTEKDAATNGVENDEEEGGEAGGEGEICRQFGFLYNYANVGFESLSIDCRASSRAP